MRLLVVELVVITLLRVPTTNEQRLWNVQQLPCLSICPHFQIFGITVQNAENVVTLPFGSPYDREQFMAALVAGLTDASNLGEETLPNPQQAFHLCASVPPKVLLHMITSVGIGQHRDVAVSASIQIMLAPRVGVAIIVMGFEQVDPQLLSLREGMPSTAKHVKFEDQPDLPTVSSVTFEDDSVNVCECPECRPG